MSLRARTLLEQYWNKMLPVDPAAIARRAGVAVVPSYDLQSLPSGPLSGAFGYEHGVPTIVYNAHEHPNRQRFTIAHELGHMQCGHMNYMPQDGVLFRDAPGTIGRGYDPVESEANEFAAELLMPAELVRLFIAEGDDVQALAQRFGVSVQAMGIRLRTLGESG